ncbi:hypothetical protein FOZ61_004332 [Perkinsus olseni]|uniref:C3H1-type domain-containing protein n=1 Tax=Perkinsus olseni TaxID=32597 RepID=A0A7J6LLC6_PEROL|nr:hypothetical protein FOZ61_004332 [Perkinsus olseni]
MKVQLYKTKVCRHYMRGSCRYGSRCTFAHQLSELGARPDFYKTKMCARRNCKDANCQYAHSPEELRSPFGNSSPQVCFGALDGSCNDPNCKLSHNKTQAQESILAGALELSRQGGFGQQQQQSHQQQVGSAPMPPRNNNSSTTSLDRQVSSPSAPAAAAAMNLPTWTPPTVQSVPSNLSAQGAMGENPLLSSSTNDLLPNMPPTVSPTSSLLSMVSSPYSETRSVHGQQQQQQPQGRVPPTISLEQEVPLANGNGQVDQEPDLTDPNLLQALETLLAANEQQPTMAPASDLSIGGGLPSGFPSNEMSAAAATSLPNGFRDFSLSNSASVPYYSSAPVYGAASSNSSSSLLGSASNLGTM